MQPPRRKGPLFFSENGAMKSRKNNNLSVVVVVFSVFLFGVFMYNEDVKSIADFPFSQSKQQEIQEEPSKLTIPFQETTKKGIENEVSLSVESRTKLEESQEENSEEKQEPVDLKSILAKEEDQKIELPVVEEDDEDIELPPEEYCDLFTGEWVFDYATHPLYKEDECEFLTAQVTCMRNGRKDSQYQNWKWQPRDCSLPKSETLNDFQLFPIFSSVSGIVNLYACAYVFMFLSSRFKARLLLDK